MVKNSWHAVGRLSLWVLVSRYILRSTLLKWYSWSAVFRQHHVFSNDRQTVLLSFMPYVVPK